MYTFQYNFYPDLNKIDSLDYFDEKISMFLNTLVGNGQLLNQFENVVQVGDTLKCFCIGFREDSLNSKYYNKYCFDTLKRLNESSVRPAEYKMIGESVGLADCCSCGKESYYILLTTSVACYPPILCGDCNLPIPLYMLPKIGDEIEYYNIRKWATEYEACDALFIQSDVGERFGYRQMSDINSKLSEEGLKICSEMAKLTGKPFYYFIHKYYKPQKDKCPKCGGNWKLKEKLHGLYTHKCDNCFIISDSP